MTIAIHKPVMLNEVLDCFHVEPNNLYLDATFGRGGHTKEILKLGGSVVAFDQDLEAVEFAHQEFSKQIEDGQLTIIHSNFDDLEKQTKHLPVGQADAAIFTGILFDFGTSQDQIRAPQRGFSFDRLDSPLDMRMNQELSVTASDLLAVLTKKQLEKMFIELGGENRIVAKKVACAIDRYRKPDRSNRVETVGELVGIVEKYQHRHSRLHPATKIFQALRIAVNSELECIKVALPQAFKLLKNSGKIITIAFHQGEDVIIKHQFSDWEKEKLGEIIFNKPLKPSLEEIQKNPSSRSAKLRAFKKSRHET